MIKYTHILILAISTSASAQSLQAFLESAGSQNIDVRLSENTSERAATDATQSWTGLLPSLTANAGYVHNQYAAKVTIPSGNGTFDTVTITPIDQFDATFKVELPLIDATRWLRASAASASSQSAQERQALTHDQVTRQIVSAFYALAGSQSVLESAQRSLKVAQAQLDQTQARFNAGVANELELVRAQAEVQRCLQVEADANGLLENNRTSLRLLSGLEPKSITALPADDLTPAPALTSLVSRIEQLPEVKASDSDRVAQQRTLTASGLALAPTVSAQFTQRFTNATGFQGQSALWNAGVNLNWRFDVAGIQAIRSANLTEQAAQLTAEKARISARERLEQDWRRVTTSVTKVTASRAQLTSAQRGAALAHQRYDAGVASQLDAITAERDLFAAEVNCISAGFELASARAALRLSSATPLEGTP